MARLAIVIAVLSLGVAHAQAPSAAARSFDAAAVKANASGSSNSTISTPPGGTFTATNVTLTRLIPMAFEILPVQITGGPDWLDSDRYDIVARPPADAPADALPEMLRTLLADRFALRAHREMRSQRIYALVVASEAGRLGPTLTRSTSDCMAVEAEKRVTSECASQIGLGRNGGMLNVKGRSLSRLAATLGSIVERVVVDQTGLTGTFDVELQWSAGDAAATSDAPTIFTALQEQLGLRLRAETGPAEMLVIDQIERPMPD